MQPGVTVVSAGHTPQSVTVVNPHLQPTPNQCQNYAYKQANILGILQVVIGALCFILQIAAIAIGTHASNSATGIWCGIVFGVAGLLGIMSSRSKGRGVIVACMVMSIIASVLTLALLISASVGLGHDNDEYWCRWDLYYSTYCQPIENKESKIALNVCLLLLSLLECIVAIWASAVCCNAVCCGRSNLGGIVMTTPSGQIQYVGQGMVMQQPVGVYPGQPVVYQQPAYGQQQFPTQQPVVYGQPQAQGPQSPYNPQHSAQSAPVPPSYSSDAPPAYNQIQSSAPPTEKN